jgi:chromosome partitioning protein
MTKKAKVIAVYSLKGGVGKTSLAVNLAAESALQSGYKTLLWDLDPQAAASYILGQDDNANSAATGRANSIFTFDIEPKKLVQSTQVTGLDLLPADKSLRMLDRSLFELGKKRRLLKLVDELSNKYDRIILDCPPGLTELSEQVMQAADLILVPVIPSALSRRALIDVLAHLRTQKKVGAAVLPIFSMVDRRRTLHRAGLATEPEWPVIPMASAVELMAERRMPVRLFSPNSIAGEAFAALWRGVDKKRGKERRV